jgi:hypothetical protein
MELLHASPAAAADGLPDELTERMDRADRLVRPWTDPAFRAQLDPELPEVLGPPARAAIRRIRRRA